MVELDIRIELITKTCMIAAGAIFAAIEGRKEHIIVDYFREKRAISSQTAITINEDELLQRLQGIDSTVRLERYPFIERIEENRYYLDEGKYKRHSNILSGL